MKVLMAGATGATGRLAAAELLKRGAEVRLIVRSPERLPEEIRRNEKAEIITGEISLLSTAELAEYLGGCDAAVSCLGHNLTLKGIFGPPRKLVTQACEKICRAAETAESQRVFRFVLMNTTGNRNRDNREKLTVPERLAMTLIRLLVPPQRDNEGAAEHLRKTVGPRNATLEWVAVRPDSLVDQEAVTPYSLHPSPLRSAIFNPGRTSRINVAHFMASLLFDDELWQTWKGKMPVIYNEEAPK